MADPIPTRYAHEKHVRDNGGYSSTLHTLTDADGNTVDFEVCTTCHLVERGRCTHSHCTWIMADGTKAPPGKGDKLICVFCGIDAT